MIIYLMWLKSTFQSFLKILTDNGKNRVLTNFYSLSLLQIANVVLPLVTIPFVIRSIGIERFGILGMALALAGYFEIITDYGFDLSATKKISIHRSSKNELSKIFSSVMMLKTGFTISCFLIYLSLIYIVPMFSSFPVIFLITYGRVIGKTLFPVWFYQGMEQMKFITRFSVISKIIFSGLTLVLVKKPEDFILVPIFNAAAVLVPGLFAQFHVARTFGVRFLAQHTNELKIHLQEGFHIFLSRVYVNLYSSFNILILGLLSGYAAVGMYSVAAKVIEAISMIFIPANNALFPYLSRLWKEGSDGFYGFVRNLRNLFLITGSLMAVPVFILAGPITTLVNGKSEQVIITTLRILVLKLPFIALGPLYTSILINQNRNEDYLWVVKNTLIYSIILTTAGIYLFGITGLAWSVVGVSIIHQLLFNQKKALITLPAGITPIPERI